MAKWLMIMEGEDLRDRILEEYKRHPQVFDLISDFRECDPTEYDKIIIGDDIWERYRDSEVGSEFRKSFRDFRHELTIRTFKSRFTYHFILQCSACGKVGVRLDLRYNKVCKVCRSKSMANPNAVISDNHSEEWISKTKGIEPKGVVIATKNVPKELGEITEWVISKYFPEFNGINIYLTTTASGQSFGPWDIALNPDMLNPYRSRRGMIHTIAHELTHQMCLLQTILRERANGMGILYDQKIPTGELATDIWTFARSPDLVSTGYFQRKLDKELSRRLTRLLLKSDMGDDRATVEYHTLWNELQVKHFEKHQDTIHSLAVESIEKRRKGLIKYIQWFKEQMKEIEIYATR